MATPPYYIGEIRLFTSGLIDPDWMTCDGQWLSKGAPQYQPLFKVIGVTFGDDGKGNFKVPDLRGRVAVGVGKGDYYVTYALGDSGGTETATIEPTTMPSHRHGLMVRPGGAGSSPLPGGNVLACVDESGQWGTFEQEYETVESALVSLHKDTSMAYVGDGTPHNNLQPFVVLKFCIAVNGVLPKTDSSDLLTAAARTSRVGEVRMFGRDTPPGYHLRCDGSVLDTAKYPALATVIRDTFSGGSGAVVLPKLDGRVPVHVGEAPGLTPRVLGESGGVETVALEIANLPSHAHEVRVLPGFGGRCGTAAVPIVTGSRLAYFFAPHDAPGAMVAMGALGTTGGGQAHTNVMPSLAVSYVICAAEPPPPSKPPATGVDALVGEMCAFATSMVPYGWLACDGAMYSSTDTRYRDLFSVIGNAFGSDGSRFAVPNLSAAVAVGSNGSEGEVPGRLGERKGESGVALLVSEMPEHTHELRALVPEGQPQTEVATNGQSVFSSARAADSGTELAYATAAVPWVTASQLTISPQGKVAVYPHENRQPFLALHFCICYAGIKVDPA